MGALLTALAVAAALFGPTWRRHRRRPLVTLEVEAYNHEAIYDAAHEPQADSGPVLRVRNASGRDTAREVEVGITIESPFEDAFIPLHEDRRLSFVDPLLGASGVAVAHIAADSSRRVYLVLLGDGAAIAAMLVPPPVERERKPGPSAARAALAAVPCRQDTVEWLTEGDYSASFEITGANFDAIRYQARFSIRATALGRLELDDGIGLPDAVSVEFAWREQPRRMI